MHEIMTYVKQNKWKFFATLVLVGGLFFAFNTFNTTASEPSEIRHRKLLSTVGRLLESEHYSPRVIDDKFSKEVFDAYLKVLDPEKNILLQSDIDSLKVFATSIDDEIHGAAIQFEPSANAIYERRAKQIKAIFESIIDKPFDFTTDDSLMVDTDKMSYASNEAERVKRWNQAIKYKVLDRYVSLIEDREKHAKAKAIADTSKIKDTVKDNFVVKQM